MKSTILLTGIKTEGRHGANPGEQDITQSFIIDVKIKVDVPSDDLSQAVDYERLSNLVKDHVKDNSYKLIETLAYNIASEITNEENINKVSISVHKPSAAELLGADDVIAKVTLKGSK